MNEATCLHQMSQGIHKLRYFRKHELHNEERPFACTICGKLFKAEVTLKKNQGFKQEKSLLPASNVTNHLKTEVL